MIYLDHNATTPLLPEVREAMQPFMGESFANPSSPYTAGREASRALRLARERVAELAGCPPAHLVFTSGGTEGNNWAFWLALRLRPGRRKLVLSAVEHPSVAEPAARFAALGFERVEVPVGLGGELDLEALAEAVDGDTALVSVMAANNETGVVYPVAACAEIARQAGALFHVDAAQALGKLPLRLADCGADFLTASAHKINGPKGTGAMAFRALPPSSAGMLAGGDQEYGLRAGTENVAGIAGFGRAAEAWLERGAEWRARMQEERDAFQRGLSERFPGVEIAGVSQPRLPNTLQAMFPGLEAEGLLALLDMEGICCSSGSACASGSPEPSRVLRAMGYTRAMAASALRFSLSGFTSATEMGYVLRVLEKLIGQLGGLAPPR